LNRASTSLAKLPAAIIVALIVIGIGASYALYHTRTATSGQGTVTPSNSRIIVVTDLLGRRVAVKLPVRRVVAVGPGALRLIVYLNATKYVVGVEAVEKLWDPVGRVYIMAHPELRSLPVISPGGPGKMPDAEEIVKVKPDVIFVTFLTREEADALQEKTGVPVVSLGSPVLTSVESLNDFYKALRLAGLILGRERRAEELIAYTKSLVSDLQRRVEGAKLNLSVYVGGIGYRGRRGITSTWCHYPLFAMLNVESVVDEAGCKGGHVDVSKEFLVRWNPDVVFIDENGLQLILMDYLKDRGFYESLKAFRDGRVYGILPFNYYATNYELALADAYYIGKILFPSRFADVNPVAKANEIMKMFDGKPLYQQLAKRYGGFKQLNLASLAGGGS